MSKIPPGVSDQDAFYQATRSVLVDALQALEAHLPAVVLVGAQAVYARTPDVALTVTAYTSDADLALNQDLLGDEPILADALRQAGLEPHYIDNQGRPQRQHGIYAKEILLPPAPEPVPVTVDLLVPDPTEPPAKAKRAVDVPPHGSYAARLVRGLGPALVDNDLMTISAPGPDGPRSVDVAVAGIAALLVAKSFKIYERLEQARQRPNRPDRIPSKDASDVYRLAVATLDNPAPIQDTIKNLLAHPDVAGPTRQGLLYVKELFGSQRASGVQLATAALPGTRPEVISAVFERLVQLTADLDPPH